MAIPDAKIRRLVLLEFLHTHKNGYFFGKYLSYSAKTTTNTYR